VLRTVGDHPTKSGVVGLLGACLGISRNEPEKLVDLANQISLACRVDGKGDKISDFHIVKNTYLRYSPIPLSRKKLKNILTLRDYLCNASFTICIQSDNIEELYEAVRKPVYVPFLGRKSCLPNHMLPRIVEADNILDAFKSYDIAQMHQEISSMLSKDTMLRVFWEGNDTSIQPIRKEWKYDLPKGSRKFGQRLEFMGYIERAA
jgi:CRISPR-associated protein Cas5/CasD subtype I-E